MNRGVSSRFHYTPKRNAASKELLRPGDISLYIQEWRDKDSDEALEDYLGMTSEEFDAWLDDPKSLPPLLLAGEGVGDEGVSPCSVSIPALYYSKIHYPSFFANFVRDFFFFPGGFR